MSETFDTDGNLNGGLPSGPRTGQQVFHELQRLARAEGRAFGKPVAAQEYLTRHTLESFSDRLNMTGHAKNFILKGGLLSSGYWKVTCCSTCCSRR
jgi:hypothetical protein